MRYLFLLFIVFTIQTAMAESVTTAKEDAEKLMNAFIGFAVKMLNESGEFYPYGAAMLPDGETVAVAGYEGQDFPPSQAIIDLLNDGFQRAARAGEYKATAMFYDVRTTLPGTGTKSDAIAVALDHADDYSVVVYFPYKIDNGQASFGDVFAQAGANNIFQSQP